MPMAKCQTRNSRWYERSGRAVRFGGASLGYCHHVRVLGLSKKSHGPVFSDEKKEESVDQSWPSGKDELGDAGSETGRLGYLLLGEGDNPKKRLCKTIGNTLSLPKRKGCLRLTIGSKLYRPGTREKASRFEKKESQEEDTRPEHWGCRVQDAFSKGS